MCFLFYTLVYTHTGYTFELVFLLDCLPISMLVLIHSTRRVLSWLNDHTILITENVTVITTLVYVRFHVFISHSLCLTF